MTTATGSWDVVRERKRRRVGAGTVAFACTVSMVVTARAGELSTLTTTALARAVGVSHMPTDGTATPVTARARVAADVSSRRTVIWIAPTVCDDDG